MVTSSTIAIGSAASTPKNTDNGTISRAWEFFGPSATAPPISPANHPNVAATVLRHRPMWMPSTLPISTPIAAIQNGRISR